MRASHGQVVDSREVMFAMKTLDIPRGVPAEERETTFQTDDSERKTVIVYSCQGVAIRRLARAGLEPTEVYRDRVGQVTGYRYEVPQKWFRWAVRPPKARVLSEAQRDALRTRLRPRNNDAVKVDATEDVPAHVPGPEGAE